MPGNVFGRNGEGYLRMSFANSLDNIAEGCGKDVYKRQMYNRKGSFKWNTGTK